MGISCRLIATSPKARSRSTSSVLVPDLRQVRGQVGRQGGLAHATLGREDRDDLALLALTPPLAWPISRAGQLPATAQGLDERGVVVCRDDLTHAAAQRLSEGRDVHPVPEEDDAQLRAVEPSRLREFARLLERARQAR